VTILLPPVGGDLEGIGLPKFPYAARAKLSFAPIGSQDRFTCGPEMHGLLSPPRPTPSKPFRPHESGMECTYNIPLCHRAFHPTRPLRRTRSRPQKKKAPGQRPGALRRTLAKPGGCRSPVGSTRCRPAPAGTGTHRRDTAHRARS
jgi:hypothetical protein